MVADTAKVTTNGDKLCTVNHIISCLDTVTQKHPYCGIMLCGDFNQLNDNPILSYPLKQIVTLATRRHNILDKVFTSIADWYHIPTILPPIGTSDHNVVLVHALASQPHSHPPGSCFVAVRSSDPSGKTLLANALNRLNWVSLYKMDDCNDMLNHFYTVVVSRLNFYLPVRMSKKHASEKPWVNDRFRCLVRQRQRAWHQHDMVKYRALCNLVQRTASKLRGKYYGRCVVSLRNAGPSQWWRAVKRITGQSQKTS